MSVVRLFGALPLWALDSTAGGRTTFRLACGIQIQRFLEVDQLINQTHVRADPLASIFDELIRFVQCNTFALHDIANNKRGGSGDATLAVHENVALCCAALVDKRKCWYEICNQILLIVGPVEFLVPDSLKFLRCGHHERGIRRRRDQLALDRIGVRYARRCNRRRVHAT